MKDEFTHNNTQQLYLASAYDLVRASILPEAPKREEVVLSYGFPKGNHGHMRAIGQCWHCGTKQGHKAIVFIHPVQWINPLETLHVLIHEMIHCAAPGKGHRKEFSQLAARVGLIKPWTATTPGPELSRRINAEFSKQLPPFPAASFDVRSIQKTVQKCRLRLWECDCGTKIRAASDDLNITCNTCGEEFKKQ